MEFPQRRDLQPVLAALRLRRARAREKWVVVGWQHDDFMGETEIYESFRMNARWFYNHRTKPVPRGAVT